MRSFTSFLRLIGVLVAVDLGRLTKEWYEESSPKGQMKWPDKVRSFDAFMRQRYPNEFLQYKTYTRLLGDTHKE